MGDCVSLIEFGFRLITALDIDQEFTVQPMQFDLGEALLLSVGFLETRGSAARRWRVNESDVPIAAYPRLQ
jgi:hypothetical protein